jgi:hypothetical protein
MGTGNFLIEHRCVVVTDEDFDAGSTPKIGDWVKGSNRNFESRYIEDEVADELLFFRIVIRNGYYSGGNIDIEEFDSQHHATDVAIDSLRYSDNAYIKRFMEVYDDQVRLEDSMERTLDDFIEMWLEEKKESEFNIVNERIDKIRDEYGYEELEVCARFSNGETVYHRVES